MIIPKKRSYFASDDYYQELPKCDVILDDFAEEYEEPTGLLGPDGRPIIRLVVPPKKQPAGFIWFKDDEEGDGGEA